MKLVLCIDNESGLMFNNRRQSRDSLLVKDLVENLGGETLTISEFSKNLFEDYSGFVKVVSDDSFKSSLANGNEGVYFVENTDIAPFCDYVTEVTVYKWNRRYPADLYCTLDFSKFTLRDETEFQGSSHEKITKAVYVK